MAIITFGTGASKQNAFYVALGQQPEILWLVLQIALGAAQHEEVPVLSRLDFGTGDHLREEIVAEIGGYQAQCTGAPRGEAPRNRAGLVAQARDDLLDHLARFG